MSTVPQAPETARPQYRRWLRDCLVFLAAVVVARLVLEAAGVPANATRYFSSLAAVFLVAIYLGVVAPQSGVTKVKQLILPAVILAAWGQGWIMLATFVSAVFRLERSHFAAREDFGNWSSLGGHLWGHVVEFVIFAPAVFAVLALMLLLHRWPLAVGPGAILGVVTIMRFWVEAMGVQPTAASAWSSSVAILLSGFYLGGVGARLGLTRPRQFLDSALALGWTWRLWVFFATVLNALLPFYKTHFFDTTRGEAVSRLAIFFVGGVVLEGLVAGLLVWGIAVWTARLARTATSEG